MTEHIFEIVSGTAMLSAIALYFVTMTVATVYTTFFRPSLTETVLAALPDITKSVKVTAEKTDVV